MAIERIFYTPRQEVYHPGEVLYVSLFFRKPFTGECEVGLAPYAPAAPQRFPRTTFEKSRPKLFEGQVVIMEEHVGKSRLFAHLSPVKGQVKDVPISDTAFFVRRLRP